MCPLQASVFALTHFCLVRLAVLRQLDELLGEHVAAITQDVTLQLHIGTWPQELHDDGVAGGVDANLHVLAAHWGEKKRKRDMVRAGAKGRRGNQSNYNCDFELMVSIIMHDCFSFPFWPVLASTYLPTKI